ncbi:MULTISPECIES: hypothetical protein [unclassified Streptomyces]|uniref:hypothetical protein n=1 Tax=unclassified Streptomyces TaxID=2593676 RepID=UPI0034409472
MTGHLLSGLAANPALPAELLDRLIAGLLARSASDADTGPDEDDADLAQALGERTDLGPARVAALAASDEDAALHLAHAGLLDAADVDPAARPAVALALLDEGAGPPGWARLLAAHPDRQIRRRLASRPGLPLDVLETLAADPDVEVVAELAFSTTEPSIAARLAAHPHAEVRRDAASNEATPPAALAALITGEGLAPARSCLVCDREEIPFTHHPNCPRTDCDLRGGAACAGGHESTLHEIRQQAARNPATPTAAAASLAGCTAYGSSRGWRPTRTPRRPCWWTWPGTIRRCGGSSARSPAICTRRPRRSCPLSPTRGPGRAPPVTRPCPRRSSSACSPTPIPRWRGRRPPTLPFRST